MRSLLPARLLSASLSLCGLLAVPVLADEFPPAIDTQPDAPPLTTPQEALKALKLPGGFRATLFAAEPEIRQPIALATDARGRLWVAENYTYAERPKFHDDRMRDRIVVLEDADGDGQAEKRTVFWDEAEVLTSVEIGFGGVWALCPPRLLFLPDRNGDDQPDGAPIVVLDGFETTPTNRHNFANGLRWGPDGWLYGRVGISAPGRIGVPGTPDAERVAIGPSLWRYHPVSHRVEEVCSGTTNAWGHDWNDRGELFFINTVIGHLWHVQPGAHFRRMFGADNNPHVYQVIEQTADHFHWDTAEAWNEAKKGVSKSTDEAGGGHAHCGMMIYLGDNWPDTYRDKVYTLNMHGRRVNVDRLERRGAGFVGKHDQDMIFSGDPWFRATELLYGPDGGVYIADWSDVGECHENDGVHRTSGRLFKVTYAGEGAREKGRSGEGKSKALDLRKLESIELAKLQTHHNDWFVRQARLELQARAVAKQDLTAAITLLEQQYAAGSTPVRLRALWALNVIRPFPESWLVSQFQDNDEAIRNWAIKLLAEQTSWTPETRTALEQTSKKDASGLVLCSIASLLQRLPGDARWPIATALASRAEFANDLEYPLMVWYGVEGAVTKHPTQAAELAAGASLPAVRQHVARRLVQELATQPAATNDLIGRIAKLPSAEAQHDLLRGVHAALKGWQRAPKPPAWDSTVAALNKSEDAEVRQLATEIAVVFGDGRALDELKKIARAGDADIATRRAAVRSLVDAKPKDLAAFLQGLLYDRDVSADAVRGLASVADAQTAQVLVDNFLKMTPPAREATIETLAARADSSAALAKAIEAKKIDRGMVPVVVVRQMQSHDSSELKSLLTRVWPELQPISADKKSRIEQTKTRLTREFLAQGDASAGRALWEKSCAKCHTLFGVGGKIGPDLTGSQRQNLDYVLENVLDPSATLLPNFRTTAFVMEDGRVINGVILTQTDQAIEVQTATDKVTLRKADIEDSKQSTQSLMPEGLLDLLSPEEVRNLVRYVMSPEQVELSAGK